MKKKLRIILLALLALTLLGVYLYTDMGKTYSSLARIKKVQEWKGYAFLGRFGNNWPAKVIGVKTAMDEIEFTLQNGQAHSYPGYYGYKLKALKLLNRNGRENVVVFRSKKKKEASWAPSPTLENQ